MVKRMEEDGPLVSSLREERIDLKSEFSTLLRREDTSLRQKTKIRWIKEGDENTSYLSFTVWLEGGETRIFWTVWRKITAK